MDPQLRLLSVLADGQFHSGEELGARLGMSRSAVWKHLQSLEPTGPAVFAVRGRGYRLAEPLELLEREQILEAMDPAVAERLDGLEIHFMVDSTNRILRDRSRGGLAGPRACLAEAQRQGRGRHGRSWVSPFGASVYLSLAWQFECAPTVLHGLGLALGVAAARALEGLGVQGVGLKWPNDLVCDGAKLGGILVELVGEVEGPCRVVAGIGVNVSMPGGLDKAIGQSWTDLASWSGPVSRNRLAGRLLGQWVQAMDAYARDGLSVFLADWRARDAARGEWVDVILPDQTLRGRAAGVDARGALILETASGRQHFTSGEVSLRVSP